MRSHGKLAVLQDDEVERLERAGAATMGASRAEVLESMYNRLEPKPQGIMSPFCFLANVVNCLYANDDQKSAIDDYTTGHPDH